MQKCAIWGRYVSEHGVFIKCWTRKLSEKKREKKIAERTGNKGFEQEY